MRSGLLRLLALFFVLLLPACSTSMSGGGYTVTNVSGNDAGKAASLISAYRASYGLGPVTVDSRLYQPAADQAQVVAQSGVLSHGNFASRMSKTGLQTGVENLAAGSTTVEGVIEQWKQSAGHNSNMLRADMTIMNLVRADSNSPYRRHWVLVMAR